MEIIGLLMFVLIGIGVLIDKTLAGREKGSGCLLSLVVILFIVMLLFVAFINFV